MTTEPKQSSATEDGEASGEVEVEINLAHSAQWAFTAPFEGKIKHLYLDTRGNVTCGVGFLVRTKADLDRFDWQPDLQTAREDYDLVRAAKPAQLASAYSSLCKAHLTERTMRVHFDAHVDSVLEQLEPHWHVSALPYQATHALVDMAFNLGIGGLSKYRKLHTAVAARDWQTAAAECSRRGIQASRNEATRALFLSIMQVA